MKKEGWENLTLTGQVEGKRDRGEQRITYLNLICHMGHFVAHKIEVLVIPSWKLAPSHYSADSGV